MASMNRVFKVGVLLTAQGAVSIRVGEEKIAANETLSEPIKASTDECVKAALKHNAYEQLIQSAMAGGGHADCSKMASGPCSLVCGGPPYFYPQRDVDPSLFQALMGEGRTTGGYTAARAAIRDRRTWMAEDGMYTPPAHNCEKCPAQFSPPAHSCMEQPFDQGGWADPEDPQMINKGNAEWMSSTCQNKKHKLTFLERQRDSWCTRGGLASTPQLVGGLLKNPQGKTGLTGRGSLGLWGPNKAGDPVIIVTGDTLNQHLQGEILESDYGGQPFSPQEYYVRLIMRTDTPAVAIPGGMVDPGESGMKAAMREFAEEAMAGEGGIEELQEVFAQMNPQLVYQGIVDDPRNTDDAWMETQAYMIDISGQDPPESTVERVRTKAIAGRAGDDAGAVRWLSLTSAAAGDVRWISGGQPQMLKCCYASHYAIIKLAKAKLDGLF